MEDWWPKTCWKMSKLAPKARVWDTTHGSEVKIQSSLRESTTTASAKQTSGNCWTSTTRLVFGTTPVVGFISTAKKGSSVFVIRFTGKAENWNVIGVRLAVSGHQPRHFPYRESYCEIVNFRVLVNLSNDTPAMDTLQSLQILDDMRDGLYQMPGRHSMRPAFCSYKEEAYTRKMQTLASIALRRPSPGEL